MVNHYILISNLGVLRVKDAEFLVTVGKIEAGSNMCTWMILSKWHQILAVLGVMPSRVTSYCNHIMSDAVTVVLRGSVPGREVRPQVVTIWLMRRLFCYSEAGDWSRRCLCRDQLWMERHYLCGNKTHKQCVGSIFTVFEERENRLPPQDILSLIFEGAHRQL